MEYITAGREIFQQGGWVMYVLLLCSLMVTAVGVERALYFRRADAGRGFALAFSRRVLSGSFAEAMSLVVKGSGFLPEIIAAAVQKHSSEKASHYMELQSGIALSKLRQRLYYLSVIVTLAPLLGLLGTISGMISSFSVFNLASGQASAITGGVGEALIATAMGLCVAIIALVVHAYFAQRVENIVTDMEQCFSLAEEYKDELAKAYEPCFAETAEMEGSLI